MQKSLLQRNVEAKKSDKTYKDIPFYVIDTNWFNKWKAFVTNDLTEKILPNDMKYISDNKKIGVLPPDIIDNSKICTISNVKSNNYSNGEVCKYKLKNGLKVKKDYIIINQYLWEWLLVNYNGGPEIKINEKMYHPSSLAPINENNEINHNEIFIDENNKNIINKKTNFNNINKNFNIIKNINNINNNMNKINMNKNNMNNIILHKNKGNKINNNNNNNDHIFINNSKKTKDRKTISFKEEESNNNSSNIESSEFEEKSKSISLDASSNRINTLNAYTFNTKFCDFKNNKEEKKKECFEDVEFIIDKNYSHIGSIISIMNGDNKK